MLGNGFIYTNRDSLSVGVGTLVSELYGRRDRVSPNELLERFKSHPCVAPLIRGGETLEYSAHMIPADGYKNLPKMLTDNLMLAGDAAGLVNTSLFHEGVNMAMASGIMAAKTILERRKGKRYDSRALRLYERLLRNSFVLDNMKSSREFLDIMRLHKELVNDYPHVLRDAMVKFFRVSDAPKRVVKRDVFRDLRSRINFTGLAKTFTSMLRGGI